MNIPYTGGCQCGKIRYEIRAEPLTLYLCHFDTPAPWNGGDSSFSEPT